ncbi:MAG: hypothetical protein Q6363_008150 [Candidatus Njordarchaeota archaeon]
MGEEKKVVLAFAELLKEDGLFEYVISGRHIVGYYPLFRVAEKIGIDYEAAKNLLRKLSEKNHNIKFLGTLHRVDDDFIVGLDTEWFIKMLKEVSEDE